MRKRAHEGPHERSSHSLHDDQTSSTGELAKDLTVDRIW